MTTHQKRRISGVMATTIRSTSSSALLVPSSDNGAETKDIAASLDGVPTSDDIIDLLQLKDKDALCAKCLSVARKLLPGWQNETQVSLERVSGAMTNAVYFMSSPNQSRVLLRVYGVGADQIIDRQHELAWLVRLSSISNNVSPQLLAIFGNGRFEEYLESTVLKHDDLRDPVVSCQIAQAMRQLHNVTEDFPSPEPCRIEVWRNVSLYYTTVREMLNSPAWKDKFKGLELDRLPSEIERCKMILESRPITVVFAHNDTQYGNVLRLANTGELVIVDFEYAGYNPRAFDIANHFCEWMYNYHSNDPATMNVQDFPTREERIHFLNAYIGDDPIEMTAEELDQSVLEWTMVGHIQWALWGIIQYSQSEIDFDYYKYFEQRLKAFRDQLAKY